MNNKLWLKSFEDLSVEESKTFLRNGPDHHHKSRYKIVEMCTDVGGKVLDCGFGSGIMFDLFESTRIEYHGIDVSHNFVKACHEMYPNDSHRFRPGDILYIPFEDDSFTTVFCRSVLEHLPPHLVFTAISEITRVASKQVILDFSRQPWERRAICYFYSAGSRFSNTYNKYEIIDYMKFAGGKDVIFFENIGENKIHAIYRAWKTDD